MTRPYAVVVEAEDRFINAGDEPPLDVESGNAFGWSERLFLSWRDGKVLDYGDWAARDIDDMLGNYYKATQIEQVLTGPIESAQLNVKPAPRDRGEAEFWNAFAEADEFSGGMDTPQDLILSQFTSAYSYRKAYFEKVFTRGTGQFDGTNARGVPRLVYRRVAFRPASTCRTARTPKGQIVGFEQDPWYLGEVSSESADMIEIPLNRSVIYVHGQRRDPINGVSDMQIPQWCYQTMKRVLFLWIRYAEHASLPRTTVVAQDLGTAKDIAAKLARAAPTGVLPLAAPGGPQSVGINTLDSSGKGGDQFAALINWLDQAAVNSVGAGFLNLTDNAKSGGGWALSSDSSDFYLQRLQAKAKEQAREYRRQVIAPLIRYNFGPDAAVPLAAYEPLNTEDITPQIAMLQALMGSRDPALVPSELVEGLCVLVAERWGMDVEKVRTGAQEAAKRAQDAATQLGAALPGQKIAATAAAVKSIGSDAKLAATGRPQKRAARKATTQ